MPTENATTWLALCDYRGPSTCDPNLAEILLSAGSLVIEARVSVAQSEPLSLVRYQDDNTHFHLIFDPKGTTELTLETELGATQLAVSSGDTEHDRLLKITFSWDMNSGQSFLTLETVYTGEIHQIGGTASVPVAGKFIQNLVNSSPAAKVSPAVTLLALARSPQCVGLSPAISGDALVQTPHGRKPICDLRMGDMVMTRDNGPQTVLWAGKQDLPTPAPLHPVRLLAPFLGLNQDIIVAPFQRILIEGPEVEYLFGFDQAFVEARYLVGGHRATREPQISSMEYYQILLENHEIIDVGGLGMESLFIATLTENPALKPTTLLADLPAESLPKHSQVARPLLRRYEAIGLRADLFS